MKLLIATGHKLSIVLPQNSPWRPHNKFRFSKHKSV